MAPAAVPNDDEEEEEEEEEYQDMGVARHGSLTSSPEHLGGHMRFVRVQDKDMGALMGCVWRSAITGEIRLRNWLGFPDFSLVDLWTRPSIDGLLDQFAADKYLFRPVPLNYRTWIYHYFFEQRKVGAIKGSDECGMVRNVLAQRCLDVPISGGRWCSMITYAPSVLLGCLTGDLIVVAIGLIVVCCLSYIYIVMNSPMFYRYTRLVTLPIRILYAAVLGWRLATADTLGMLGLLSAFVLLIVDVILGDLVAMYCYRLECWYEIVRILPNRIFVCQRHGAALLENIFEDRGKVDSVITSTNWGKRLHLIADLRGILVELRPLTGRHWNAMYQDYMTDFQPFPYVGVDLFSPEVPSADALNGGDRKLVQRQRQEMLSNWGFQQPTAEVQAENAKKVMFSPPASSDLNMEDL